MITENLSTLKIHKLSQTQYDRELANGRIDENALYLTPDEDYVSRSEFEALLACVEALENGGGSAPTLTINISKRPDSNGLSYDLYINNEVVKSVSHYDGTGVGTFTYENVTSAYIKITENSSGYAYVDGTQIWYTDDTTGEIYNLPTTGTVNIESSCYD